MPKKGYQKKRCYYSFRSRFYGALFNPRIYRKVINEKLSCILLPFLLIILLSHIIPSISIYKKFTGIDLVNPSNDLSKRIINFIDQLPESSIKEGELFIENNNIVKITDQESNKLLVEFNKEKKGKGDFSGVLLFGPDGIYYNEARIIIY